MQPLILVLENLHWIDSETQALLDRLVESLPTARLLLLVNYRPEYQHGWGSKTCYVQLRLDPLLPENARELLHDLLGEDGSLGALKGRLIEWTEGNPFFLEETVQALVETHALVGARGAYRLMKSLGTIQVPATVQAVLAARIDRLPLEEKQLLQTAAVIGKDVPHALLQTIAALPDTAFYRGLDHLQAAEFLYETSLFLDIEYTFKHALTQQVAYGSLLHERQRALHRRVGDELERQSRTQPETPDETLAYHYSRSDQREKAVEYLVKAGHKAAHRSAHREALDHFQNALPLIPTDEASDRVLGYCAGLLLGLFRGKEAATAYERLLASARQSGNRAQELTSLLGLFQAYYIVSLDDPAFGARSLELGRQAYSLACELDDKRSVVRVLLRRVLQLMDFDPEYANDAAASCAEALALSREIGDDDLIIDASSMSVHLSGIVSGPTAENEQQSEDLRKRLEARRDLPRLKEVYFRLMQLHRARGNFARCIECCDAGIRLAAEIGALPVMYPTEKANALISLGRYREAWASLEEEITDEPHHFARMYRDLCMGRYFLELMAYEKASVLLQQALDEAIRLHRWRFAAHARLLLATSRIRTGQLDPATLRRVTQELMHIREDPPAEPTPDVMAAVVMAELLLAEGRLNEALRLAEASTQHADRIGLRPVYLSALVLRLRLLLDLKRWRDIVVLADDARRLAEEMSYGQMLWRIRAARAQARRALGDEAGATEDHETAAAVIRKLAETIPDEELRDTFIANAFSSSIVTRTPESGLSGSS